ncbi:MAG: zinc-ribbon domain containing protein [Chloroflexota bacterium]|nr:MAG: zinc-ribbon domain containing protein [Chloroflexota bacterium]
MSLQDKTIQCSDCGTDFSFTAEEQEFYKSKGYTNEPKRCPPCRQARKTERNGSRGNSYGLPRQTFAATCAQCGNDTQVPFKPASGRPVYCSDCYSKVRPGR